MRIITLKAENVKRLKAVEITPEGDTVVIAGRNAQGKSSVLDSIWMALAGADGAKETTRPIRDGEEQASVELNLGDLVVTRRWTKAGSTLTVASPDGASYPKPQTVLDGLLGYLSFDPLEFAEQPAKQQLRTLLDVVDLPFDPATLDMQRKGVFDQRTEINREIKRLATLLADLPQAPEGTPDEEVSISAAAENLARAERETAQYEAMNAQLLRDQASLRELFEQARALEACISESQQALAIHVLSDVEGLRQVMVSAEDTNIAVRMKLARKQTAKELSKMQEDETHLSLRLTAIDDEKAAAIADAKMPIDGLSFDEEGVLYQGVPFSQVSDSERLRVSVAMAMALNPKIRVIRITDGSLLDSKNMALISEMASEHDFQVWIERVDESGEVGITIEDGEVAGAD